MSTANGKPTTLAGALLAIQAAAPQIPLDATNPHFKSRFASLAGVMEKVRPVVTAHEVAIVQLPTTLDGEPALTTRFVHSSGEEIGSTMLLLPAKADPQGQGAALTYARRYMVLAMLGLVGDEDDEGMAPRRRAKPKPSANPLDAKRVNEIGKGIGALGLTYEDIGLMLGACGADGLRAASGKALRERLESLTSEQADAVEAELERRAA